MKPDARLLALLALAALPATGWANDAPATLAERSEQVADVRDIAGIDLVNSRGRVVLRPSADGRIHLAATRLARIADPAAARRYLAETTVDAGARGDRYVVEVHYPRRIDTQFSLSDLFTVHGRRRLGLPSVEVVLEVSVPGHLPVSVRTTSGNVVADAAPGPVDVGTSSGNVELRALRSAATVQSASGDVGLEDVSAARVRTASGDVTVHGAQAFECQTASGDIGVEGAREALVLASESGDVDVSEAPAGIDARSTSGAIQVHAAAGQVRLSTASGEIGVELQRAVRGATVSSTSGSVSVELAPGLGAQVTVASTSGNIDCRAGMTIDRRGPHRLEGRVGPGGPAIHVQTVSGDLTVTSGGK